MDKSVIEIITLFLNGLSTFAKEAFSQNLTRVDFHNLWIDFIYSDAYIIVLATEVKLNLRERITVFFDTIIKDLENYIHRMLARDDFSLSDPKNIETFGELLDLKLLAMKNQEIRDIVNTESEFLDDNFQIDNAFICEKSGIPIMYRSYVEESTIDPILISSMLSMLSNFVGVELKKKIKLIHLENLKVCFKKNNEDILFILIVNSYSNLFKSIPDYVYTKVNHLLDTMIDTFELMGSNVGNLDDPDFLINVMDEYIKKTLE